MLNQPNLIICRKIRSNDNLVHNLLTDYYNMVLDFKQMKIKLHAIKTVIKVQHIKRKLDLIQEKLLVIYNKRDFLIKQTKKISIILIISTHSKHIKVLIQHKHIKDQVVILIKHINKK
jgi:hypothetical protein